MLNDIGNAWNYHYIVEHKAFRFIGRADYEDISDDQWDSMKNKINFPNTESYQEKNVFLHLRN